MAFRRAPLVWTLALVCIISLSERSTAAEHWYPVYVEGVKHFRSESYASAVTDFEAAILRDAVDRSDKYVEGNLYVPYFPHYYLAVSFLRLGRFREAQTQFELACDNELTTEFINTLDD